MRWGSLCSGVGGFELGLLQAGHEIAWGCEIDEHARSVYQRHFPDVKLYRDIRELDEKQLSDVDGICAGFPCQPFSVAGRQMGFEDSRGNIFFEIARIVREKQPRVLLLENVKGLLHNDGGRTYRVIRDALDEMGYTVEWQLLNSKYHVPQNRERIFIVGHLRERYRRNITYRRRKHGTSSSVIKN